jgi:hypothetical protein
MMMAYGKDYEVSYIVSINFRANLDAQNAGNCISGLQISNIFCGTMRPDAPRGSCVVCQPHGYPPLIYYLTERSLFKKCSPPPRKIIKKGPDKISNEVVYVYCVSKAVGQTNTAPPPNKIRPVRPCGSLSPTSGNIGFYCRNKICFPERRNNNYISYQIQKHLMKHSHRLPMLVVRQYDIPKHW